MLLGVRDHHPPRPPEVTISGRQKLLASYAALVSAVPKGRCRAVWRGPAASSNATPPPVAWTAGGRVLLLSGRGRAQAHPWFRRLRPRLAFVSETPAVQISGLVKNYGRTKAVAGLSMSAAQGQITAVLGPNGAGKTTTVEICEGYRRADEGTVRVLGLDPARDGRALRERVGVMTQAPGIPTTARAGDYLKVLASFYATPLEPATLIRQLGLAESVRTPFRRLSGGQQQRLSLAAAIIGRPELVFLDEPTAGLDPQARHATWELVAGLRASGATIILTTHYLEEAERLADYVVIVDHGTLVAEGTPAQLTGSRGQLRFSAEAALDTSGLLSALPTGSLVKESPAGHYLVEVPDGVDPQVLATVTTWCAEQGVLVRSLRIESKTLEDIFLELTGRELRS